MPLQGVLPGRIAEIAVIARDRRDRKNPIPAMSAIPCDSGDLSGNSLWQPGQGQCLGSLHSAPWISCGNKIPVALRSGRQSLTDFERGSENIGRWNGLALSPRQTATLTLGH